MVRSTFILLLSIGMSNSMVAQQVHSEKKVINDSSQSTIGFRQKSPSTGEKRTASKNTAQPSAHNTKTSINKVVANTDDAAKVSEIMKLDYHNMPADVQSKVNANKLQGKNLLEGVAKVFIVEIKECKSDADHKNTLLFLKTKKGFINSQFVSTGLVKIIVEPTFDSADLKDAMNSKDIHFNFLNRSYALKN
ncbi:MAG: hypothetical protein ABI402_17010 [Ferruginibacter sp.]